MLLPVFAKVTSNYGKIGRDKPNLRRLIVEELRRDDATTGQIDVLARLKQHWHGLVPRFRVLCLSELNDVTPMWHHYADAYKGTVLEFEAVDGLDSAFLVARPVKYQDTPPAIASKEVWVECILQRSTRTYRDLFTEYEYVKTLAWEYEREWRIVSFARDSDSGLFSDYPFHPRELAGVYLGTLCSQEDERDILALRCHGFEHVRVFKARRHGTEARFVFDRIC